MKMSSMREEMVARFLQALREDTIPWHRSWLSYGAAPSNAVSHTRYHGANALWLSYVQEERGYDDPRWCTFAQAADKGWHVKKGERGTKIEFWSLYDTEEKRKLSQAEEAKLRKELTSEEFYRRVKPIARVYTVFNGEQIEGIPQLVEEFHTLDEAMLMEKRDTLLNHMGVGFREGGEEAFYRISNDTIYLPDINRFESEYDYMATFLHEAGHATSHEDRLNRPIANSFGSPEYAREELRAEIASAFTAQSLQLSGSNPSHIKNHAAYVQNWITILEKNPEELFSAIRDAEQISDYLLEKGEFLVKYQKSLVTDSQAAKLRLIGRGKENDFEPALYGDIAKVIIGCQEKGLSAAEVVEHITGPVDSQFQLYDVAYAKNIICSILSHGRDEYERLLRVPVTVTPDLLDEVSRIEREQDTPEKQRLTRWFGDYGLWQPKEGVTETELVTKLLLYQKGYQEENVQERREHMKVKRVETAGELRDWLNENDLLMNLTNKEIETILHTFQSHGYVIGIAKEGLVRLCDIGPSLCDNEIWTMDELIDLACEWNYEDMERLKERVLELPFGQKLDSFKSLKNAKLDESVLSKAFSRTIYGKEVHQEEKKLATFSIQEYQQERRCR